MKKILLISLLLLFLVLGSNPCLANDTGHRNIESIEIPETADAYLLINTSIGDKERIVKKVPKKLFGWSVYVNVKKLDVKYKKYDVFSKSNRTSNEIRYDYTFTNVKSVETSIELDSSLKRSISGKIEIVNVGLDETIREKIGNTVEVTTTEQLKYSITVSPYCKVTVYATGEAKLSSGAAKLFIFGIPFYKGNWEYLDIVTEYYELYEEKYN